MNIGFIGIGNMGGAILKGLSSSLSPSSQAFYYDINDKKMNEFKDISEHMIGCSDEKQVMEKAKYVIMAVKPQYYDEVFVKVKDFVRHDHVIITIAPGFSVKRTKTLLGDHTKVVRVMPNVPALVEAGVSAISFSEDSYSEAEKQKIMDIFTGVGRAYEIPEKLQDAVVPISGSSPAYIFMMIEAMADAGVSLGLPRDMSYEMAAGTVLGSAKMVLETGDHPGYLKDMVCSPGGTTIEAVATLEKNGFRGSVIDAMKACYTKIEEMKKQG